MNKILFAALALLSSLSIVSYAETQNPDALLMESLKDSYNFTLSEQTNSDYKSYFSSNRFQADFENKKWAGGVDVIVDGAPLALNANADETQTRTFQEKIRHSTSVSLSESTKQSIASRVLNPSVLNAYTALVRARMSQLGFIPSHENNDPNNSITFTVKFNKAPGQPDPKVSAVYVDGGFLLQGELRAGMMMTNPSASFIVRRQGNVPVVFVLQTSLGGVVDRSEPVDPMAPILAQLNALKAECASLKVENQRIVNEGRANFVQSGHNVKSAGGTIHISFPVPYSQPPEVTVSPFWNGGPGQVGFIDTILQVTATGFDVTSPNTAPNFYISWVAVGRL